MIWSFNGFSYFVVIKNIASRDLKLAAVTVFFFLGNRRKLYSLLIIKLTVPNNILNYYYK